MDHLPDIMDLMRTFIAVDIPPAIHKSFQEQMDNLRNKIGNSSIRWIPVRNIHLTLKFLGDVPPANLENIFRIIREEADSHPAFDITIGGLGSFPNSKRARVLFIGIQAPAELAALQLGIESASARMGYISDKRSFSPHLTIGRVKQGISTTNQQIIHEILGKVKIDSLGNARVDSVHLYKSELKPSGAVYTKLFSAPLQNRGEV